MTLESLVEEFFAAGKKAVDSQDPNKLHAFRVAAKRLRYTIEILDPEGGRVWLRRLRVVQRKLGDMNDAFVAERFLRSLPSRTISARPLAAKLRARARAHIAGFQKTWRHSFGASTEKALITWARGVEQ